MIGCLLTRYRIIAVDGEVCADLIRMNEIRMNETVVSMMREKEKTRNHAVDEKKIEGFETDDVKNDLLSS